MAGKLKYGQVFQLLYVSSVVLFLFVFSLDVSSEAVPPEDKTATVWLTRVKRSGNDYWSKLKETLGRGHSHFFPPNIE